MMIKTVREAVTRHLKNLHLDDIGCIQWVEPREIIEALYPMFEEKYPSRDTFKRLVFRALRTNQKIIKNFHGPYYAYKRKQKITEDDIELLKRLFEMVHRGRAWRGYDPKFKNIPQYPDIPLERTDGFKHAYYILSKLWKDPRDEIIINAT